VISHIIDVAYKDITESWGGGGGRRENEELEVSRRVVEAII